MILSSRSFCSKALRSTPEAAKKALVSAIVSASARACFTAASELVGSRTSVFATPNFWATAETTASAWVCY
jgi:hypothetical protein